MTRASVYCPIVRDGGPRSPYLKRLLLAKPSVCPVLDTGLGVPDEDRRGEARRSSDQGTGSTPPGWNGWHFRSRQTPNDAPRISP